MVWAWRKGRALAATPRGPSGRGGVPDSGRRRWVPAVRHPRSPFAGYIAGSSVRYRVQQYGISVSIFEQGNLQGNSSGPSDPPGLVVCLFFLFPPGAFRQLALSLYTRILTHQSYRASVLTPVLQVTAPSAPLVALSPLRNHAH